MKLINFNCDVGEGLENESSLMPYIKHCNIACGGHIGDLFTMQKVVQLAIENNVLIGAHPSYPDKVNFGRKSIQIADERLIESIRKQIDDLISVLYENYADLYHIKPHGALYNDITANEALAQVFLKAITPYKDKVALFVPFGSIISKIALKFQFKIVYEAFADRRYMNDLSLVSREVEGAVINDFVEAKNQVISIASSSKVLSADGEEIHIKARTFCVHSDTPNAVEMLKELSSLNDIQ